MVTREELELAASIIIRWAVADDELWNELPEELHREVISDVAANIQMPEEEALRLRGMLALAVREARA